MTIEIAPPVVPVKVSSANDTAATKEKSGEPDKPQTGDPTGFMAILASLGQTPSGGQPEGPVALPDDCTPLVTDVATDLVHTAKEGELPLDASALLAQALQWTIPGETLQVDAPGAEGAGNPFPEIGAMLSASGVVGAIRSKGVGAVSVDAGLAGSQKVNILGTQRKGVPGQMDTAALQSQADTALAATLVDVAPTSGRDAKSPPVDLFAKMVPSVTEVTAPVSVAAVKRDEQTTAHGMIQSHSSPDVAVVASPGGWLGSTVGAASVTASDAAVVVKPSYIAEQVSYWISNDVQKAEMKLDGLGASPVEVSISMNGNQAHVAFRTDEVQARDALENASVQLKEMLQRDGVVLSGMSVGTSGSGEAGAGGQHDRNARQGTRNIAVVVEQPVRVDRDVKHINAVGRALDLFV